jgi:hypothetical protein
VQPLASVTVTEYEVADIGDTLVEEDVEPLLQA